jgi:hypothetical protein
LKFPKAKGEKCAEFDVTMDLRNSPPKLCMFSIVASVSFIGCWAYVSSMSGVVSNGFTARLIRISFSNVLLDWTN